MRTIYVNILHFICSIYNYCYVHKNCYHFWTVIWLGINDVFLQCNCVKYLSSAQIVSTMTMKNGLTTKRNIWNILKKIINYVNHNSLCVVMANMKFSSSLNENHKLLRSECVRFDFRFETVNKWWLRFLVENEDYIRSIPWMTLTKLHTHLVMRVLFSMYRSQSSAQRLATNT